MPTFLKAVPGVEEDIFIMTMILTKILLLFIASLQDKRSLGYQVPAAPLESRLKSLAQNVCHV